MKNFKLIFSLIFIAVGATTIQFLASCYKMVLLIILFPVIATLSIIFWIVGKGESALKILLWWNNSIVFERTNGYRKTISGEKYER